MIRKKLLKIASVISLSLLCYCGTVNYMVNNYEPEIKSSCILDSYKEKRKLEQNPKFMAGASKAKITPEKPVCLAGFNTSRKSEGVHDDLYAKCVVLDDGQTTVGLVSLDLIGLFHDDVEKIRKRISEKYGDSIIIASTHTHSGPDTIGYFSIPSGVDEEYMDGLEKKVEECVNNAIKSMEHAKLELASIKAPSNISKNIRVEGYKDDELSVIKINGLEGKTLATIINYAAHPEILERENKLVSADFVGYLSSKVEEKLGGTAIFLNGALGGMITPRVEGHDFKDAEKTGLKLYETVLNALEKSEIVHNPKISLKQKKFKLYVDNWKFLLLRKLSIIRRKEYEPKHIMTEVNLIRIGPAELVTIPGEAFPSIGFWVKDQMNEKYKFVIGLGNDEIGYIMTRKEFKDKLYSYEQSMSLGKKTWQSIKTELQTLLKD